MAALMFVRVVLVVMNMLMRMLLRHMLMVVAIMDMGLILVLVLMYMFILCVAAHLSSPPLPRMSLFLHYTTQKDVCYSTFTIKSKRRTFPLWLAWLNIL